MLDLPMSRTDMADHLGLTIETVCRVLAHLRRDGTIAIERGRIAINDAVALQQMASEPRH
jgi:CRP-like cAMP-binding protein